MQNYLCVTTKPVVLFYEYLLLKKSPDQVTYIENYIKI